MGLLIMECLLPHGRVGSFGYLYTLLVFNNMWRLDLPLSSFLLS